MEPTKAVSTLDSDAEIRNCIEEVARLYRTRQAGLAQVVTDWDAQIRLETEIESHINRLVAGDAAVLRVARRLESADNAGILFAVLRVLAGRGFFEEVVALAVSLSATPIAAAIADALVLSWPKEETVYMRSLLRHRNGLVIGVVAQLVGTKRLPLAEALTAALEKEHREPAHAWLAWALGRVRHRPALPLLFEKLERETDPHAATLLATALLRHHHLPTLRECRRQCERATWPLQLLAIAGDASDAERLRRRFAVTPNEPTLLLALGLAGDPAAVPPLCDALAGLPVGPTRVACAFALRLLTGAPTDLGDDAEPWRAWWRLHGAGFKAGTRYRLGRPVTPAVLLEQMAAGFLPPPLRQTAYEEMVVRYNLDAPFEAHLYVAPCRRAVASLREQAAAHPWQAGRYYFGGATT